VAAGFSRRLGSKTRVNRVGDTEQRLSFELVI
jgi:hypothetical protein